MRLANGIELRDGDRLRDWNGDEGELVGGSVLEFAVDWGGDGFWTYSTDWSEIEAYARAENPGEWFPIGEYA